MVKRLTSLKRLPRSHLQLEHFWVERFSFEIDQLFNGETELAELPVRYSTELLDSEEDPNLHIVRLRIRSARKKDSIEPYKFDVQIAGAFSFSRELPAEGQNQFLRLNAPSILYGICRGLVAATSGMGSLGAIQIPSVNFVGARSKPL